MNTFVLVAIALVMFGVLFATHSLDGYLQAWSSTTGVQDPTGAMLASGNPSAYVTDPMIDYVNQSLGTNWGFAIVWLGLMLAVAILFPVVIGAFLFSACVYILGSSVGLQPLSTITVASSIPGGILSWYVTRGSEKLKVIRRYAMIILILFIALIVILFLAGSMGIIIPGWNGV